MNQSGRARGTSPVNTTPCREVNDAVHELRSQAVQHGGSALHRYQASPTLSGQLKQDLQVIPAAFWVRKAYPPVDRCVPPAGNTQEQGVLITEVEVAWSPLTAGWAFQVMPLSRLNDTVKGSVLPGNPSGNGGGFIAGEHVARQGR